MRLAILFVLAASFVATDMGCGMRRPFERPPGTIEQQRRDVYEHDPYADQDLGPEVVGARPREFQKPDPIPERSRPFPPKNPPPRTGWFSNWFKR